jgi:hypothetical protein
MKKGGKLMKTLYGWMLAAVCAIVLLGALPAAAQQQIDPATAKLAWDAPATGGAPDAYHVVTRDATTNAQVASTAVPASQREILISVAIGAANVPGRALKSVVIAANAGGESPPSNEVAYTLPGAPPPPIVQAPGAPQNLRIVP